MKTLVGLAALLLAGFVTAAVAQNEAVREDTAGCRSVGASRLSEGCAQFERATRIEREMTVTIETPPRPTLQCRADVVLDYMQRDTIARIDGTIGNADCAASSGEYTIEIRIRDATGEAKLIELDGSWRRDDDRPVTFRTDYAIGGNVELVRVRPRASRCRCAERAAE